MGRKKFALFFITFILFWLKSYVVYKLNFELGIESIKQEFILFITPISSGLFILGLALLYRGKWKKRMVVLHYFLATFLLFSNIIFYRFFNDFITIPLLFQTSNMSDLGGSVLDLMYWKDVLIFFDVFILMFFPNKKTFNSEIKLRTIGFILITSIGFFMFNMLLAQTERTQLLTRTFDRVILVKNLGVYNYQLYDVYLQTKTSAKKAFADKQRLIEIEKFLETRKVPVNDNYTGIGKNKNIIYIEVESIQNFVSGIDSKGEPLTPFLNEFKKESLYFPNFYHQTAQGKTSDTEFIVENSLFPLSRGAVFFTNADNTFYSFSKLLKENGYYTSVMHGNNKTFWNRNVMYPNLGVMQYYSEDYYDINEANSINYGMEDIPFFNQSIEHIKAMPQPFFTKLITLTNHYPFILDEKDAEVEQLETNSRTVNRFVQTIRYTDTALKLFIERLKEEGVYENSIIVIYGDHYGISRNHDKAMGMVIGQKITNFKATQLQRVPLLIHIPGMEGKIIPTVSGQIDLRPTMLNIMGIKDDNKSVLGNDILSTEHKNFVILRDGTFVTKDYLYVNGKCYNKFDEKKVEKEKCNYYKDERDKYLKYSDDIIYGDLLRFSNYKSQ